MPLKKDRVLVDTNLWISFLLSKNQRKLDQIIFNDLITLIFSQELLAEFYQVARRPRFTNFFSIEDLDNLVSCIHQKAIFITTTSKILLCRDPKDDFLLELARDGQASHLVTGDKDLLDIGFFENTVILTITDYLASR